MLYRKHTDASGTWISLWYEKNLQGDIVAIYTPSGTKVMSFVYDAWGNFTRRTHTTDDYATAAGKSPFLYRGYYYDSDLGFYVTGTRCYDPAIGRFINADSYVSTGQGLLGYNMYAYCKNNPVMLIDLNGNRPSWNDVKEWFKTKIIDSAYTFVRDVGTDIQNYERGNTSEQKVIDAKYFSSYKGTFVLKVPGDIGFSFGIIVLGNVNTTKDDVKHEYGHRVQLDKMGVWDYTTQVALPSVTASWLYSAGKLQFDYYSSPWEADADREGGVVRGRFSDPWTEEDGYFMDLIKLFFK